MQQQDLAFAALSAAVAAAVHAPASGVYPPQHPDAAAGTVAVAVASVAAAAAAAAACGLLIAQLGVSVAAVSPAAEDRQSERMRDGRRESTR